MKKVKVIERAQVNAWNRMVNEIAGTKLFSRFSLQKEYKNNTRWILAGWHPSIRACYYEQTGEKFFIKEIKDRDGGHFYLYWENSTGTDSERWLLNDMACEFFGC